MTEHNGQRLSVIGIVLLVTLAIIFSPVIHKLTHPNDKVASLINLKPGIDIVGGTSLLYEIKVPEGTKPNGHLASDVAEVLKKRVDPEGVRNLIWRPQGDTRLEIQMPLSGDSQENAEKRKELSRQMVAAQDALEATNINADEVINAVEGKNGKTRADLDRLASDSQTRKEYFHKLADTWDAIQKAHQTQNADEEARLRIEYNNLLHPKPAPGEIAARPPIAATNLQPEELDSILSEPDHKADLESLKKQFANFPARVKAIDQYVAAYDAVKGSRGSLDDVTDLKRKLKGAGVLEFHMLATDLPPADYQKMVQRLQTDGPRVEAGDTTRWFEVDNPKQFHSPTVEYNKKHYVLAYITPDKSLDNRPGVRHWALKDARIETQQSGEQVCGFAFDPQGGKYFGDLTGNPNNLHKPMAIVLDGRVISAPNINSKITESGIIEGGENGFSADELDYLVSTLRAGSLPAQLADEPISEKTVGPQLGQDNLRAGLLACVAGLAVVGVFLISYYYIAGIVAFFAVVMNVLLILAVMSALNATFTLPSIAGIVLTVGTAVDANVLVFERLREEQLHGVGIRLALRHAFGKAASAIWDSNMTTIITSIFLIIFGTEEVRGFGITLIICIVASLFTALFVTRTIFNIMVDHFGVRKLGSIPMTFPKWDKLLRPNIDWMRLAGPFIAFSVVAITVGAILFGIKVKQGKMFDIEFAGGTSVTFDLKNKMPIDEVRHLLEKADPNALPSPQPQSIGGNETTYEVSTPNTDSVQVKDAVLKTMRDANGHSLLKVDVPSSFDDSGKTTQDALNAAVVPLDDKNVNALANGDWAGGFKVAAVRNNKGGVAIVLNHINPPLSAQQIADRVHQQQFQLGSNDPGARRDFTVETPTGASSDRPATVAVLLANDDAIPYMKDREKWEQQVAGPLWSLTNEAVNRPAQLQQVKTFDAQVAGDTTRDAITALILSVLMIMAYIWFRFGNLKYGTATVVALLHDVAFTIAALGFAHYLVNVPWLRSVFQLEAFRINMTVVAGILTIMGYSMIDTIVVFDRIRENRGKYGHVSRKVINDAVNQTLSRTLLTAGTNIVTVAIMYFLGGQGIHGFTFVLLVGILVGTYSSVAIASPILLVGRGSEQEAGVRPAMGGKFQRAGA
jgi:SecD/SecF fusion protein